MPGHRFLVSSVTVFLLAITDFELVVSILVLRAPARSSSGQQSYVSIPVVMLLGALKMVCISFWGYLRTVFFLICLGEFAQLLVIVASLGCFSVPLKLSFRGISGECFC